ncbi:amidase [Actinomycetospora termitidis]|uniref:Amidase n=1 Tax=Actinomycetospora termitidis TaxID=3053470 RepID=A0ABT7M583_9PSEU|nr:amidase [Actinomycetospora sp. Odt1-22]MDL5155821.1 amidase [Actinomycetospora sp. Odt1-22]
MLSLELSALGLVDLAATIRARRVSCVEVARVALARIDRVNPAVDAIVARRDPEVVLAEAAALDDEVAAGRWRGVLHGVPQAVKDLAETAGEPFAAGSPVFRDRVGVVDAPHVARMRAAGALLVGRTNTPELGFGSQTYNPVYGTTRNPWDTSRTVGGSSGGAAAALACRMLPAADGSDYMGSLRNPAAWSSVYGLRPSRGRVPGVPGFVAQMGEAGPMARSVADLAALLGVMTTGGPVGPLDRADALDLTDLRPADPSSLRVGWLGDLGGRLACEPGLLDLARAGSVDVLASLGAGVEEVVPPFDLDALWDAFLVWRWWNACEMAPLLEAGAELKPELVWEIEHGVALTALQVHRAAAVRAEWFRAVVGLFERFDVLIAPATQVHPFPADVTWPRSIAGREMDTYHRWMETVAPWSMAGVPVLGAPAGFTPGGLPVGVQFIGAPGADRRLLEVALTHEAATGHARRVPPLAA